MKSLNTADSRPREGAGDRAERKGKRDRRPGISGRGVTGQDEDAGADGAADAEPDQIERGQGALRRMSGAVLALRGLVGQGRRRFSGPEICHVISILSDALPDGCLRPRRRDRAA
jgi:hypothetical protein